MSRTPTPSFSISEILWRFFVSLRVTILLLLLWLALSVVGTLIPQNVDPGRYVELYGTALSGWLLRLNLSDVYHSTGYSLVLLLLMLNLAACTLNTLPSKLALARRPRGGFKPLSGSGKRYLTLRLRGKNGETALEALRAALSGRYTTLEVVEHEGAPALFAERQAFSHFMVYVVHIGLVVIILGGLVTSLWGFEGSMQIPEGQTRDRAFAVNGDESGLPLGFAVRLDRFRFERFPNGMPKTYASTLTLLEGGRPLLTRTIEVNTPLAHGGFTFYQSSYSEAAPIRLSDAQGQNAREFAMAEGEVTEATLGGKHYYLRLDSYFDMGRTHRGVLSFESEDGTRGRLTLTGKAEADAASQAEQPLRATFYKDEAAYASGILVSSDPGVWLVWLGSALFMAGLYLTFYSAHRRLSVVRQGQELVLCALTSRNPSGFRRELTAAAAAAGLTVVAGAEPDERA